MNKVILTGNLTRDPEVRYTQSGKAVATFSLAVSRTWKKPGESQSQQLTDYINIVAWDKSADFCGKYLIKGSRILVEGRIQSRSYEAQDGSKRYVTEVVSENIEFAGARPQSGNSENSYGNNNYSGGNYSNDNNARSSAPSNNGNDMIDSGNSRPPDDFDIPF